MLKNTLILLMLLFLSVESAWALEIGGVTLDETLKAGDTELILNGAGLRRKFGLKVYAVGLYLKAKSGDAPAILGADEPMALDMKYRMKVPPEKINEVFFESFGEVLGVPKGPGYTAETDYGPESKNIVTFMSWVSQRKTEKDDSWIFIYTPGKGTDVHIHDGKTDTLMGTIPGLEFKKTLFSIWLGENAPVGSLKDELLGK